MSDPTKKRCPSADSSHPPLPPKRSKLQESCSSSVANVSKGRNQPASQSRKPSEYDDTGWMAPSEFAKRTESESQLIDAQKECEEAVRLLSEFTQSTIHPAGQSSFSEQPVKRNEMPTGSMQTINPQDLASISCTEGIQTDASSSVQFGSPGSSISSPALVIATTPPKKRGVKKRKLPGASTSAIQQRSQEKKSKAHKTPEKSKLMIATRQLIRKSPSKGGAQSSGNKSAENKSPRKSSRLASLDYRISWKKGKKKVKKIKKKKTADDSNEEASEFESSFDLQFDSELEAKLEENAAKNNLTAINVKSILHVSICFKELNCISSKKYIPDPIYKSHTLFKDIMV